MPKNTSRNPADYIVPLNINHLEGRMLRMAAPKTKQAGNKEILFVYGSHSSLERWFGIAQVLNRYGAVTMPDLPGFGGMDSFYTIGKKPTLDNMADYLAAFIKLRYRRKKVVVVGLSFGFIVATRMLQRYPELTKKVTLLVSIVGFAHKDDFKFTRPRYMTYIAGSKILTYRPFAFLFYHITLNPWLLKKFYGRTHNAKKKFALAADDPLEIQKINDAEVKLWRENDVRTWGYTTNEFLKLDNCKVKVDMPVWHVGTKDDSYFDAHLVEQHMRIIFNGFEYGEFQMAAHAPSVMAEEKDAAGLVPPKLRRRLSRLR